MHMFSYGLISVVFVEESWCEDILEGYVAINASEGHLEKACNQRRKGARKIKREKAALFPSSSTCCDYWLLVTQDAYDLKRKEATLETLSWFRNFP